MLTFTGFAIGNFFRRTTLRVHDIAVNTGETYSFHATMTERRENVGIDLAGEDHFGHFQSRVVSNPAAFDNGLLDAHLRGQITQLLSTAVHDAETNTDLMQQGELFGERHQAIVIFSDLT